MTKGQRAALAGLGLLALLVLALSFARPDEGPGPLAPRDAPTDPTSSNRLPARAPGEGVLGLFVEPDDGREPIIAELEAARREVTLQVYLLSDEEVIAALEETAGRGVAVRVLLEEQPFGGNGSNPDTFRRLQEAGIAVQWANPTFRFSHVKTFVIDRRVAIVMNLNLTRSAFTNNREFGVVTTRAVEVAQAAAIFEADWDRAAEPPDGPLVVSPTTSRSDLLALIDGATSTLDLYAEVVRDEAVLTALTDAVGRGVRVRLVVSNDGSADRGDEERAALAEAGVEIRYARGLYIHAKLILADGRVALVGSQNLTGTSLDQNRELGVLVDDPAAIARLVATFEADFASGRLP